jgi:hypothetical protein
VNLGGFRHGFLDARQFGLLLVVGNTDATHLPRFPALLNGGSISLATEQQTRARSCFRSAVGLHLYLEVLWALCRSIDVHSA